MKQDEKKRDHVSAGGGRMYFTVGTVTDKGGEPAGSSVDRYDRLCPGGFQDHTGTNGISQNLLQGTVPFTGRISSPARWKDM